jgi:hypothetical protein
MSTAYGEDLSWFFDAWIYQPNHPTYQNQYWFSNLSGGNWEVGFVARQTQTNSSFHKMPIEIKLSFTTGADTTIRVMNDSNNQMYIWSFNRQPNNIIFDPSNDIILKTATLSVIPPLPVELTSFTASVIDNSVVLSWITATELNNYGFEVERTSPIPSPYQREGSETGRGWEKIGFVIGAGTTTEPQIYSFNDKNITSGKYSYRLKQIDNDGQFEYSNIVEVSFMEPTVFSLEQNFPNPFNPSTKISWQSPISSWQTLKVYDVLGNEVGSLVDEYRPAGRYEAIFDASKLSSGIYFYHLQADNFFETKKMILIK